MLLIGSPTTDELGALLFPTPLSGRMIQELQPVSCSLRDTEAAFMATGPGIINAVMAIAHFLGWHAASGKSPVTAILYVGLTAAFDLARNPLRSICAIDTEIWPEYGLNDGTSVIARAFSQPLWKNEAGEPIYDTVELAGLTSVVPKFSLEKAGWQQCNSLTVAGVSASFARREQLWNRYRAQLENTEGFSVAYAALRFGIQAAEIRVVSHKAGPRSREEKDTEGALAILKTILPALNLI